jgi:hypothetical protein
MTCVRVPIWIAVALCLVLSTVASAQAVRQATILDPNIVSERDLLSIPHLNNGIVKDILERRHFLTIGGLDAVLSTSLTAQQRADVYQRMFVAINLNTASDADILLIPGVGRRMLHEFKEYRPYRNIAQFRREIGKYVNDEELARLERYVTLD